MLLLQTAATCVAIQPRRWVATAGSAVLGLTAAVAGISGFFDGQLGRADLSGWFVVAQAGYVAVAWGTAIVAGLRIWRLRRADRGAASSELDAGGVV
jgi:hypothetical protein